MLNGDLTFKGSDTRVIDLLRYYSGSNDEEAFKSINSKMKNQLDVMYEECYSLCLFTGGEYKQISGTRCTDLSLSCLQNEDLPVGANYLLGRYSENNFGYEIKLYIKDKNSNEVKTEHVDVYFMNKLYANEFIFESQMRASFDETLFSNYADAIKSSSEQSFSLVISEDLDKSLVNDALKRHSLSYKEGIFSFSAELNDPLTGCLNTDKTWKWGDFTSKDDCQLAIIYRPELDFEVSLESLGLTDYQDYVSSLNLCKGNENVALCLKTEFDNFDVNFDEKSKIIRFSSHNLYFFDGELQKIVFEQDFT